MFYEYSSFLSIDNCGEDVSWNDLWKENYEAVFVQQYRRFMVDAVDSLAAGKGAGLAVRTTVSAERTPSSAADRVVLMERTDLVPDGIESDAIDEDTDNASHAGDSPSSPEFPVEDDFDETEYKDDGVTYEEDDDEMEDAVEHQDAEEGSVARPNEPVRFIFF